MVVADGDASVVRICIVQFDFADDVCVGYILASALMNVLVVNDAEGFGPIDLFALALRTYTNSLAQMAHFFGV